MKRDASQYKKKKKTVDAQNLNNVKDEVEDAPNWRRAFTKIFQHLKWLNSYAKINYIAALKYAFLSCLMLSLGLR